MSPAEAGTSGHDSGLVLVGARHGTNEFPHLTPVPAAAAARWGHVIVALELGDDARDPISAFSRSAGTVADQDRLLAAPSWQQHDGRASQATFRLADGLRAQIAAGAVIELDVFDATPFGDPRSASQIERERMLAERLLSTRRRGATLALTGNVHAELVPRSDAAAGFVPAAALIAEDVNLVSLPGANSSRSTRPRLIGLAAPTSGRSHHHAQPSSIRLPDGWRA